MLSFTQPMVGKHFRVMSPDEIVASPRWPEQSKAELQSFKQQAQPTDVVYYYCSEQSRWEQGMGSEGYMIVRGEQIVAHFLLAMN